MNIIEHQLTNINFPNPDGDILLFQLKLLNKLKIPGIRNLFIFFLDCYSQKKKEFSRIFSIETFFY